MIRRSLYLIILLAIFSTHSKAQTFELPCPAGSSSYSPLQTFNNSTGKWRQNYCIDANGNITQNSGSSGSIGILPGQLQDAYGYGVRSGQVRYTASMGSGGNVVTCTNCFTLAQQGWLIQVTTGPSFATSRVGSTLVLPQTTIQTVTDASHVTVSSGTANATVSNATVGFGPDSTAAMTSWWTAITGSATTNCGSGIMPPGFILVTNNFGSNSASCIPTGGEGTTDMGTVIRGWGPKTSYIVPMSSFNFATNCVSTHNACFFDFNGMRLDSFGIYGLDFNNTNVAQLQTVILPTDVDTEVGYIDISGWGAHDASNHLFGMSLIGAQNLIAINIDGGGSTGLLVPSGSISSAIMFSFIGDQFNALATVGAGLGSTWNAWGPTTGGGTEMVINGPSGSYVAFGDFWNSPTAASIALQINGGATAWLHTVTITDNINSASTVINMPSSTSSLVSFGSGIVGPTGGNGIIIAAGATYCGHSDKVTATNPIIGTPKCNITNDGNAAFTHLTQPVTGSYAGSCSMAAGTTCTITITQAYTSAPLCFPNPTTSPATAVAGSCALSGTTLTVTAGASNSLTWNAFLIGNAN